MRLSFGLIIPIKVYNYIYLNFIKFVNTIKFFNIIKYIFKYSHVHLNIYRIMYSKSSAFEPRKVDFVSYFRSP